MTRKTLELVVPVAASVVVLASALRADDDAPNSFGVAERLFTLKILPVLTVKCFGCHGDDPAKLEGELDLRSLDAILRGGESGKPAIVRGDPAASPIYRAVRWNGLEMPPKENDRLTSEQISWIER